MHPNLAPSAACLQFTILVTHHCVFQGQNPLSRSGVVRAPGARVSPALLAEPGVGPVVAAQMLISWSHSGRVRSEAAFASLAGVAPLEASSGQRSRHRLNRGGDRALNRALHTVAITRMRCHPETRAYEARRTLQGKSHRDIRRCLKRSISRRLDRIMESSAGVHTTLAGGA